MAFNPLAGLAAARPQQYNQFGIDDVGEGEDMLPGEDAGVRSISYGQGKPNAAMALETLQGSGNRGADLIESRGRQESLLDEMKRNRYLADTSKGKMTSGATPIDISSMQSDLDVDPNFGVAQRADTARYRNELNKANMAGLATPQEAAARGQRLEEEKLRQPLEIAKTNMAGGAEEARIKAEAAQKLQETSGVPEYYGALSKTLGMQSEAGQPNLRSISKSGASFAPADKPINPALFGRLQAAQKAYDSSQGFFGKDSTLKAQVDQIQHEIDAQKSGGVTPQGVGHDPDVDALAQQLISNPKAAGLPWDQLQKWVAHNNFSPDQLSQLQSTLHQLRGF